MIHAAALTTAAPATSKMPITSATRQMMSPLLSDAGRRGHTLVRPPLRSDVVMIGGGLGGGGAGAVGGAVGGSGGEA